MNEIKCITPDSLIKIVDSGKCKIVNWNGLKLYIRNTIGYKDTVEFVNSVMSACIDYENNRYTLEVKEFAIRANVIMRYASVELPVDIETQYKIVYDTDLYDVICKSINIQQLEDIKESINMYLKGICKE